jgi:hypothetical protein
MEERLVVALVGGGVVGGGWEERWRRWWRCKRQLFLSFSPVSSVSLLSPSSIFFVIFSFSPLR